MRSRSSRRRRGAALVLGLLLVVAAAAPGAAQAAPDWERWFAPEYVRDYENNNSWAAYVPPPPFAELPTSSYAESACKSYSRPEGVQRYCALTLRCLATNQQGSLVKWCDVLTEAINKSNKSLRNCTHKRPGLPPPLDDPSGTPECVAQRDRLHSTCHKRRNVVGPHLDPWNQYLCDSFYAAYPTAVGVPPGGVRPPDPPGPGEMPDPSICSDPQYADFYRNGGQITEGRYCELRNRCQDPSSWPGLAKTCADLRERELLRKCQTSTNTLRECTEQHRRLTERCKALDPAKRKDDPVCWELDHPGEPGPSSGGDGQAGMSLLGGTTWFCKRADLSAIAKRNCAGSGSAAMPYPLSNYGIDWQYGGNPVFIFEAITQWVMAHVWDLLRLLLSLSLQLLEWAFSLPFVTRAMPQLELALLDFHENVLGEAWMLTAIAVAGLFGIWNGLVRRQTIQTFTSLLATVLLMVAGLVIIYDPKGTVGRFSNFANDASLGLLGVIDVGKGTSSDGDALAGAEQRLFQQLVERPWCALQFGEMAYCDAKQGDETVKDAWLKHPGGSDKRFELYEALWKSGSEADKDKVRLQTMEMVGTRGALLMWIIFALLPAMLEMFRISLGLLVAAFKTVAYTLAVPPALIAAAFGEAGRNAALSVGKKLAGAIIQKFVFAGYLAILLFAARLITEMEGLGWNGRLLMLAALFWTALLKHNQLVGWATGNDAGGSGGSAMDKLFKFYLLSRMANDGLGLVKGAARAGTYPLRKGFGATRRALNKHGTAKRAAVAKDAQRQLDDRARASVGAEREAQRDNARRVLADADKKRQKLDGLRGQIDKHTDQARKFDGEGRGPEADSRRDMIRDLKQEVRRMERALQSPQVREAQSVVSKYGDGDIKISNADVQAWQAERQNDLGWGATDSNAARDRQLFERLAAEGQSRGTTSTGVNEIRVRGKTNRVLDEVDGGHENRRHDEYKRDVEAAKREVTREARRRKVYR